MAQCLRERPLVVHLLGQRRRGQPPGPPGRVRPEPFDGVPHRAEVVGVLPLAELHPLRVTPVQFGADEAGHVDAVDGDVAEVTGDADVDEPAVPDRDAGQVTVCEPGAAQVRDVEPGCPELGAAAAVAGAEPVRSELRVHPAILPLRQRGYLIIGCCHGSHRRSGLVRQSLNLNSVSVLAGPGGPTQ